MAKKRQKEDCFRRSIAFFLLISFTLSNIPTLHAETLPGGLTSRHGVTQAEPDQILCSLALPEELGSIQEVFFPRKDETPPDKLVIYLQDAHANEDAETNIQKIIRLLEEKYGLSLVLLEGGEGKLDNLFFKSFPGQELKEKVLKEYLRKADLSGGEAAAILNGESDASYYGIETQTLYNENKQAFFETIQKEKEISGLLASLESELEGRAVRILSSPSKTFHEQQKAFQKELIDLIRYLKALMSLRGGYPGKTEAVPNDFPELRKVLTAEDSEKEFKGPAFDAAMNQFLEESQKILPGLTKDLRMQINGLIQQYRTAALDGGALVRQMEETARTNAIPLGIPEILKPAVRHAQTLSSLQGTKVFAELEILEEELRGRLPGSEEEKQLLQDFYRLELLKRLAKLELSHKNWEELKEFLSFRTSGGGEKSRFQNRAFSAFGFKMIKAHLRFYELAGQRDAVLFENINRRMEKEKSRAAIVVTGGYHSGGITQKLKDAGTPFILIAPRINQSGDKTNYWRVMQGERSFMRYFKGSLWDALAQDYAAKLAASLNPMESASVLKQWRDRIIQNCIAEERITEAGSYTRYVDALVHPHLRHSDPEHSEGEESRIQKELDDFLSGYFDNLQSTMNQKLKIFSSGLEQMWKTGGITPESVQNLFSQMNSASSSASLSPDIALIRSHSSSRVSLRAPVPMRQYRKAAPEEALSLRGQPTGGPDEAISGYPGRSEIRTLSNKQPGSEAEGKEAVRRYAEVFLSGENLAGAHANLLKVLGNGIEIQTTPSGNFSAPPAANARAQIMNLPENKTGKLFAEESRAGEIYLKLTFEGESPRYYDFKKEKSSYLKLRRAPGFQEIMDYAAVFLKDEDLTRARTNLLKVLGNGIEIQTRPSGRFFAPSAANKIGEIGHLPKSKTGKLFAEESMTGEIYLKLIFEDESPRYYGFTKEKRGYLEPLPAPEFQEVLDYVAAFLKGEDLTRARVDLMKVLKNGIEIQTTPSGNFSIPSVVNKQGLIQSLPENKTGKLFAEESRAGEIYLKLTFEGESPRYYGFTKERYSYFKFLPGPGFQEIIDYAAALLKGEDLTRARTNLLKVLGNGIEIQTTPSGQFAIPPVANTSGLIRSLPKNKTGKLFAEKSRTGEIYLKLIFEGKPPRYYGFTKDNLSYFKPLSAKNDEDAGRILAEWAGTPKAIFGWIKRQYDRTEDFEAQTIDLSALMTDEDKAEGLIPAGFPVPKKKDKGDYKTIAEDARDSGAGKNLSGLKVTLEKKAGRLSLQFSLRSEARGQTLMKDFVTVSGQDHDAALNRAGLGGFEKILHSFRNMLSDRRMNLNIKDSRKRRGQEIQKIAVPGDNDRAFSMGDAKHLRIFAGQGSAAGFVAGFAEKAFGMVRNILVEEKTHDLVVAEGNEFPPFKLLGGEMQSGPNMIGSQLGIILFGGNFLGRNPGLEQFKDEVNHNPARAFVDAKAGFPMANSRVYGNQLGKVIGLHGRKNITPVEVGQDASFRSEMRTGGLSEDAGKEAIRRYAEVFLSGENLVGARENLLKVLGNGIEIQTMPSGSFSAPSAANKTGGIVSLPKNKTGKLFAEESRAGEIYLKLIFEGESPRYYGFTKEKSSYLEPLPDPGSQKILDYVAAFLRGEDLTHARVNLLKVLGNGIEIRTTPSGKFSIPFVANKRGEISRLPENETGKLFAEESRAGEIYLKLTFEGKSPRYYGFTKEKSSYLESLPGPGFQEIIDVEGKEAVRRYAEVFLSGENLAGARANLLEVLGNGIEIQTTSSGIFFISSVVNKKGLIQNLPKSKTGKLFAEESRAGEIYLKLIFEGESPRYYGFTKDNWSYLKPLSAKNDEDAERILAEWAGTPEAIFGWIKRQYDPKEDFEAQAIDLSALMTDEDKAGGLIPAGFPVPKKNDKGDYETIPENARDSGAGKNLSGLKVSIEKKNKNLSIDFTGYRRSEARAEKPKKPKPAQGIKLTYQQNDDGDYEFIGAETPTPSAEPLRIFRDHTAIEREFQTIMSGLNVHMFTFLAGRYGMDVKNILWGILGAQLTGRYDRRQVEELINEHLLELIEAEGNGDAGRFQGIVQGEDGGPPEGPQLLEEALTQEQIRRLAENLEQRFKALQPQTNAQRALLEMARAQTVQFIRKFEENYFFRTYYSANPDAYIGTQAEEEIQAILRQEGGLPIVKSALEEILKEVVEAVRLQQFLHERGLQLTTHLNLYQLVAVNRMLVRRKILLADEMGLGKTLEAISTFLASETGEMVVMAPKLALSRWMDDLAKHTDYPLQVVLLADEKPFPALLQNSKVIVKTFKKAKDRYEYLLSDRAPPAEGTRRIILMNYESLPSLDAHRKRKESLPLRTGFLALDEVHLLKNVKSKTAQTIFGTGNGEGAIEADYQVLMSGTPLENKPADLLAYMKYLSRGGTSDAERFFQELDVRRFATTFRATDVVQLANLFGYLSERMIRRLKQDVVTGLPVKHEITISLNPLTGEMIQDGQPASVLPGDYHRQLDLYELALANPEEFERLHTKQNIETEEERNEEEKEPEAEAAVSPGAGSIQLTRLRQTAIDPGIFISDADSIKFDAVEQLIKERLAQGKSIAIFTDYKTASTRLKDFLIRKGYGDTLAYVDGDVTRQGGRQQQIDRIQNKQAQIIVATTATMGLAVELTQLDSIIWLNRPWKPSTYRQAIDRAHRFDPVRNTPGKILEIINLDIDLPVSIDRMIAGLLRRKEILAEMIVNGNLTPEILAAFRDLDAGIVETIQEATASPAAFDEYERTLAQQFRLLLGRILNERDPERQRELWDQAAILYISILEHKGSFFANMASLDHLSGDAYPELKGGDPRTALDVASGPSTLQRAYERKQSEFTARNFRLDITDYDSSREMLAHGVARPGRQILGAFEGLGALPPDSYEIVNLSYAFRYAAHPAELIGNIHRILKGGGLFVLILPPSNLIPPRFYEALRAMGFEFRVGEGAELESRLDPQTYGEFVREYGREFANDMAHMVQGKFTYLVAHKEPGRELTAEGFTDEDFRLLRELPVVNPEKIQALQQNPGEFELVPEGAFVTGEVKYEDLDRAQQREALNEGKAKRGIGAQLKRISNLMQSFSRVDLAARTSQKQREDMELEMEERFEELKTKLQDFRAEFSRAGTSSLIQELERLRDQDTSRIWLNKGYESKITEMITLLRSEVRSSERGLERFYGEEGNAGWLLSNFLPGEERNRNVPERISRFSTALEEERDRKGDVNDVLEKLHGFLFGKIEEKKAGIHGKLFELRRNPDFVQITAAQVNSLFEKSGLPIASTEADRLALLLNSAVPAAPFPANMGRQADQVLEILKGSLNQRWVIEYRVRSNLRSEPESLSQLEDLLKTARDFVMLSPRSKVYFTAGSRSEETALRRLLGRLTDKTLQRQMKNQSPEGGIFIQSATGETGMEQDVRSVNLVVTADPLSVLRRLPEAVAFDFGKFADGSFANNQMTPAQSLSGAIASLLKEQVEGLVRKDGIIRFRDKHAAAGFELLVQALAQAARAELRTSSAA